MLKFFRRIRQKLLSENKFSKYILYAIGEIILVVIGILIALQINNWNEARKNVKKEINYLNHLIDELETNKELSEEYIFFSVKQYEAANYLSNVMTSKIDTVEVVTFIDALIRCQSLAHINYSTNVWEELKSTGDLSIIENKDLTQNLSIYFNYLEYPFNLEKEFGLKSLDYRDLTNEVIDFDLKKEIVDSRLKTGIISHSRLDEVEGLVTKNQLKPMITQLREIKGLSGLLSDIYLNRKLTEVLYNEILTETDKLQVLIKKEIELLDAKILSKN